MRLKLAAPEGWQEISRPPQLVWTHPELGIRVEIDPVIPLPADRKTWGESVLLRDRPEGGAVQQVDIVDSASKRGWPESIVSAVVRDAAGHAVEFRVAFFYEMLYYGGSVLVRVPKADIERWEQTWREVLVGAIQQVDIDFASGGVDYLDELYAPRGSDGHGPH